MKRVKRFVLDSYAILCYLEGEKNARVVAEVLKKGLNEDAELFMSVINWGEIFYIVLREQGEEAANLFLKTIARYPINIIDVDKNQTLEAAHFKAFNKISYADAFAAALSKINKAHLLTGDIEFKNLENEIKIIWL